MQKTVYVKSPGGKPIKTSGATLNPKNETRKPIS
jgi:hypothetical protein